VPSDLKRVTIADLAAMKRAGQKIVMTTAYDALFGGLVDQAGIDVVLVGDSVATVLGGEETTLPATLGQMIYHGRMVRRRVTRALVVVDLPFLSYQVSVAEAIRNAGRVLQRTGAGAVKLEGGAPMAETIAALVGAGIPVMGHLGFTPQSVHALGGFRVQGTDSARADRLAEDARAVEAAGAFALVLELMPSPVGRRVTEAVSIPTIGIGAGPHCDGQVLVLHDLLGLNENFQPRFLKTYADLGPAVRAAVARFVDDVRSGGYPGPEHEYGSPP
jgi:3-methyl-2-oxobutanoate hydroxymethyltransferase